MNMIGRITFLAKEVENQNENPDNEHKENKNPKDESQSCTVCNKIFKNKESLRKH